MQKKIIALAVAGLASTAAFAQTNVTIYGIADAGVAYVNNSQGRDGMAVQSGLLAGSRLGFKGTEDLGNGLKAVFVLEQGFNIDNGSAINSGLTSGTNSAFQRQAFVGLSSAKAGTLTLGRQYAPGYYASCEYDAVACSVTSAGQVLATAGGFTIAGNSNARWNNAINYATPNFGGFQAQVIYRAGEQANNMAASEGIGLGLKYAGGPVSVSYVFHHTDTTATGTDTLWGGAKGGVQDEHFIGATFDAKVVKIIATAQVSDWGGKQLQVSDTAQLYTLGAIVPVGKGNIHGNVGKLDLNGRTVSGAAHGGGWSYTAAYTYGLSKRTTLYTAVNYTDLEGNAAVPAYAGGNSATNALGNSNTANLVNGGGNGTTVGVGINHAF